MAEDETRNCASSAEDRLASVLVERHVKAQSFPIRYVAFLDMLGFSAVTKECPGSLHIEMDPDGCRLETATSASAERFRRFHTVLDNMAMAVGDASRPERMMVFSDCAFAVYDNALQAATSLARVMRQFIGRAIPVRMCLAKGTCHFERFSIESFQSFDLTRSMFYGSGIVFAVEGEKGSGRGCRIFLHTSLEPEDHNLIRQRFKTLGLEPPNQQSAFELNFLCDLASDGENPANADIALFAGLTTLQGQLKTPLDEKVRQQYDNSFSAFNRMRRQFSRSEIAQPDYPASQEPPDSTP